MHPTAQWTAQQLVEAFPWDEAPKYLLRDRDSICDEFVQSFDLTYCDIALVGPPNLKRFKDSEMYDAWKLFHEMHARLAPSCPKANRAAGSGEYQASEALIGSFAKTDDDDIDMDF